MLWLAKDSGGLCLFVGTYPPDWDGDIAMMNVHDDSEFLGYVKPEAFGGEVPADGTCLPVVIVERKGK